MTLNPQFYRFLAHSLFYIILMSQKQKYGYTLWIYSKNMQINYIFIIININIKILQNITIWDSSYIHSLYILCLANLLKSSI